ncbi:MAG: MoaD/ThiS family protein [Planctomycetaceae bacterium]
MPRVFLPPNLRPLADGRESVEVEGRTVREVIANLDATCPGVRERLMAGDQLKPGLAVSVGGSVASLGIRAPVPADAEVHFLPAIGGG